MLSNKLNLTDKYKSKQMDVYIKKTWKELVYLMGELYHLFTFHLSMEWRGKQKWRYRSLEREIEIRKFLINTTYFSVFMSTYVIM